MISNEDLVRIDAALETCGELRMSPKEERWLEHSKEQVNNDCDIYRLAQKVIMQRDKDRTRTSDSLYHIVDLANANSCTLDSIKPEKEETVVPMFGGGLFTTTSESENRDDDGNIYLAEEGDRQVARVIRQGDIEVIRMQEITAINEDLKDQAWRSAEDAHISEINAENSATLSSENAAKTANDLSLTTQYKDAAAQSAQNSENSNLASAQNAQKTELDKQTTLGYKNEAEAARDLSLQYKNDAASSAEEAAISADKNTYQGLWPNTGGSAEKGNIWQTQVGGVPTGYFFTALKNTTASPSDDGENWKFIVDGDYVNQAQEELINGKIFPESGVVQNGHTVPIGTTHLRVLVDGDPELLRPWGSIATPCSIVSVPSNFDDYLSLNIATDQGDIEFVTEKTYKLRGGDSRDTAVPEGWGYTGNNVTIDTQAIVKADQSESKTLRFYNHVYEVDGTIEFTKKKVIMPNYIKRHSSFTDDLPLVKIQNTDFESDFIKVDGGSVLGADGVGLRQLHVVSSHRANLGKVKIKDSTGDGGIVETSDDVCVESLYATNCSSVNYTYRTFAFDICNRPVIKKASIIESSGKGLAFTSCGKMQVGQLNYRNTTTPLAGLSNPLYTNASSYGQFDSVIVQTSNGFGPKISRNSRFNIFSKVTVIAADSYAWRYQGSSDNQISNIRLEYSGVGGAAFSILSHTAVKTTASRNKTYSGTVVSSSGGVALSISKTPGLISGGNVFSNVDFEFTKSDSTNYPISVQSGSVDFNNSCTLTDARATAGNPAFLIDLDAGEVNWSGGAIDSSMIDGGSVPYTIYAASGNFNADSLHVNSPSARGCIRSLDVVLKCFRCEFDAANEVARTSATVTAPLFAYSDLKGKSVVASGVTLAPDLQYNIQ